MTTEEVVVAAEPVSEEVVAEKPEVEAEKPVEEPPVKRAKKAKRAAKRAARRENIEGLSRPAMHRIKRAAKVERLDAEAVDATRSIAHDFLKKVLADSVSIAKHQKRKTIRAEDVQEAVEMQPQIIFPIHAGL